VREFERLVSLYWVKTAIAAAEGWWFDTTRRVRTAGYVPQEGLTLIGPSAGSKWYIPGRAATQRRALKSLPILNHSGYTFIDIGSGRGRALFVAAEYPFRRIEGIEFATELHLQARENILAFRGVRRKCTRIECVNMNAIEYPFPDEDLVLYLFNPFDSRVMEKVLSNLETSLENHPRDVFLVITYPELVPVVRSRARFKALLESHSYCIYRAVPQR
jgi:SAM-dependent methyltransferase